MNQFTGQSFEDVLFQERKRIVGLCATLTGNKEVAEDLAQEVLLEAWRSIERLRDVEQFSSWLSGIARNICLRWARKQYKHELYSSQQQVEDILLEEELASNFDVEIELEHKELVELLDHALHILPPTSREVLIARYVEESSLSEVAERLGLHVSTTAMRLKRGKLALRRILSEKLELKTHDTETLEETGIWCTVCGQHRLLGLFKPAEATLILVCPECGDYSRSTLSQTSESQMFQGIKSIKPALSRLRNWNHRYYSGHLDTLAAPCLSCGRMTPLQMVSSLREVDGEHYSGHWLHEPGVYQVCNDCHIYNWISLAGLSLALPEGQQFLRKYPRIRTLPIQQLEVEGRAARVICFESVAEQVRFETVIANDKYEVVYLNGRRCDERSNALS